jgi:hypothetical protein
MAQVTTLLTRAAHSISNAGKEHQGDIQGIQKAYQRGGVK